jgi:hypothetical protein
MVHINNNLTILNGPLGRRQRGTAGRPSPATGGTGQAACKHLCKAKPISWGTISWQLPLYAAVTEILADWAGRKQSQFKANFGTSTWAIPHVRPRFCHSCACRNPGLRRTELDPCLRRGDKARQHPRTSQGTVRRSLDPAATRACLGWASAVGWGGNWPVRRAKWSSTKPRKRKDA